MDFVHLNAKNRDRDLGDQRKVLNEASLLIAKFWTAKKRAKEEELFEIASEIFYVFIAEDEAPCKEEIIRCLAEELSMPRLLRFLD